ncbi:hypothetical protein M3Y99_01984500 [Aphelenchoides fujianensis]|nr:hypothetical protein M3Y99_01984500 [Aphelenchoides fujianensis]
MYVLPPFLVPFVKMRPQKLLFDPTICMNAADSSLRAFRSLVSPATFNTYNQEAFEMLRATRRKCGSWAFTATASLPNNLSPFTRLSSARSSMASTAWNRYFRSRSAHATTDSVSMYAPDSGRLMNRLGENDILLNLSDEGPSSAGGRRRLVDGSVPNEMFTSNYELMTASTRSTSSSPTTGSPIGRVLAAQLLQRQQNGI